MGAVVDLFNNERQEEAATFQQFWDVYPKKMARPNAEMAWAKLRPNERRLAIDAVPIHVQAWVEEGRKREFIPYPATWLNHKRFYDELDVALPELTPCRWTGCKSTGIHARGESKYCEAHMSALKRGETPGR